MTTNFYRAVVALALLVDALDSGNDKKIAPARARAKKLVGDGGSFKREKLVNESRGLK